MATVITESTIYATTVTAPDDADALNVASIIAPGVGLQPLTDRTNNLVRRCGGGNGAGEFQYLDVTGSQTPRTRTRIIGPHELGQATGQIASGTNAWYGSVFSTPPNQGWRLSSIVNFAALIIDLNKYITDGGTLTRIRFLMTPGAARTVQSSDPGDNGRGFASIHRYTPDFGTPAVGAHVGPLHGDEHSASLTPQLLDTGVISEVVDKSASVLYWKYTAGDDAGASRDDADALEITWIDIGPQGF